MGLSDLLGKIKDLLSLEDRKVVIVAVGAALASGALLLFPDDLLAAMGLTGFRNQFRPWIGLSALLSLAWLVSFALYNTGVRLQRLVSWVRARVSWRADTKDEAGGIQGGLSWGVVIPPTPYARNFWDLFHPMW